MPLVLAIEPDLRQAAIIKRVIRQQVRADLVLVDSRDAAIAALTSGVPDVVLITALLSPRDEEELVSHLRSLDGADHLQTHTIPQLASSGADPEGRAEGGSGLLGRFRRKKEAEPIPGCDPSMFADEVRAFLKRAAELKAEAAAAATRPVAATPEAPKGREEWPLAVDAPAVDPSASAWSSPFEWRRSEPPQAAAGSEPSMEAAAREPLVTALPLAVIAEEEERRRSEAERARLEAENAENERLRLEAQAELERLREQAEAEAERLRAETEAERQRARAEAEAEAERLRARAEAEMRAKAEQEAARWRAQIEAEAAERERQRRDAEARAERERQRLEAEAAAERDRLRREAEAAAAERERLRLEAEAAAAERERLRREAEAAAAERERQRLAAEAAERERLRLEEEAAAAERERLRVEAEVAEERERLRREAEELAAERERIRQSEVAAAQAAADEHEVDLDMAIDDEPVEDAFAEFREEADGERGIFRLMPMAAWTRRDAPSPIRSYASASDTAGDDPIERFALPPHVARVTYPRGCRIRRVRVPAQAAARVKTPHPVILSKRALQETRTGR